MKKGFTLIEIVVSLAIIVLILTAISLVLVGSNRGFAGAKALAKVQSETVAINQIYQNEARHASSVRILPGVPEDSLINPNFEYIYSGVVEGQPRIMYRRPGRDPVVLYEPIGGEQSVYFTKADDKTVKAKFQNTYPDAKYHMESSTVFENMANNVDIDGLEGTCLEFNYASNSAFLTQFNFMSDDNAFEVIGTVDEVNKTATAVVPTSDLTKLIPQFSIIGEHMTLYDKNGHKYDLDSRPQIDFTNEIYLYVFAKDGSYKQYTLIVTGVDGEDDTLPHVDADGMDLIPTYKGGDPLEKKHRSMPTDGDELNAVFSFKENESNPSIDPNTVDYVVTWYAVDYVDDIHYMDRWQKVAEIENNKKIDVSNLLYRDKMIGKYVFYKAQAKSESGSVGTPVYSIAESMFTDITKTTPYVYVQLNFGKMWGTSVNEIDYKYPGYLTEKQWKEKRDAIDNAYAKSDTFRNGGKIKIDGTEYNKVGYRTNNAGSLISSNDFKDARKIILPGDKYDSGSKQFTPDANNGWGSANETNYIADLKDMSVKIKGHRSLIIPENEIAVTHSIILAVNQYHSFYEDKRKTFGSPWYLQDNSGIRYSISTEANSVGGYAISTNIQPENMYDSTDKGRFGGLGYYFEFINRRNWNNVKDNGQKGIKMIGATGQNISEYFPDGNNIVIGAKNVTSGRIQSEIPYFFSEINTSSFKFDFASKNDVTIDTHVYDSSDPWDRPPTVTMQLYGTKKENTFNVPDKTKKSTKIYYGGFGTNGQYSYTNNGKTYSLNSVKAVDNTENGVSINASRFRRTDGKIYTSITAWGYNDPLGEFELTVKNVEPIYSID